MPAFGKFSELTFINGIVPPINDTNLNELERVAALSDQELAYSQNYRFENLKKYFWGRNCKAIEYFNVPPNWTTLASTTLTGLLNDRTGDEDTAFVENDNTGSTIGIYRSPASVDLEEFNDKSTSTTSDIIALGTYISDHTLFSSLTLKLGDDASNYYSYQFSVTSTGRLVFQAKKSAFSTTGSPTGWNDIGYIRIEVVTLDNAQNEFVGLFALMLYRNDPVSDGQGQPFQKYTGSSWENFFTQETDLWFLYFDPSKYDIGMQLLSDSNSATDFDALHVHCNVIDFLWKTIMYCKADSYSTAMTWYVDNNNYAAAYIDSDIFYLEINEGGSTTTISSTLDNGIVGDQRFLITLEKNADTIRAMLECTGEIVHILEHETTISSSTDGCLYYGHKISGGISFISDFMVSNVNNMDLDEWDKPKLVYKIDDQTKNNDAALDDDDELWSFLPPNSVLEVEAKIYVDANNDTPDFQCDYVLSDGASLLSRRIGSGMGTSSTNGYNSEFSNFAAEQLSVGKDYGVDTSGFSSIIESFIIQTSETGGKVQLRWAQAVANATNTILKGGSYLKITKLDVLMQNE